MFDSRDKGTHRQYCMDSGTSQGCQLLKVYRGHSIIFFLFNICGSVHHALYW